MSASVPPAKPRFGDAKAACTDPRDAASTIFVSIASYNDPFLPLTLDNCLATARYPENLTFGICWQYDRNEPVNLDRFRSDERFRFSEHPIEESEGGCWARAIAQGLGSDELYTMQIDSHMVFAPGWDANLKRMMRTFPAEKPMITMIAPLFELGKDGCIRKRRDHGIRTTRVAEWRAPSGWSPWFDWGQGVVGHPIRNRFLSGQFVFTLGTWNSEVRQDPNHYYWGEEFALTLRSYSHGYDLFLPDEMVVWHMYHTEKPPRRHWENGPQVVQVKNEIAFERLKKLAYTGDGPAPSLGRYGLGPHRSLADFEVFSGMDLKNRRAHPDVFMGRPPDPVTILKPADWLDCVSYEEFSNG
ncbi:MAG: GlcNAc-transferase family protein [Pseudomonadota bacterium]